MNDMIRCSCCRLAVAESVSVLGMCSACAASDPRVIAVKAEKAERVKFASLANCWFEHDGTLPAGRQWHKA